MSAAPATATASQFLTTEEVSQRYGGKISVRTLQNWRNLQQGPKFMKAGGKVLYRISDIDEWEKKRTVNGTCEYSK